MRAAAGEGLTVGECGAWGSMAWHALSAEVGRLRVAADEGAGNVEEAAARTRLLARTKRTLSGKEKGAAAHLAAAQQGCDAAAERASTLASKVVQAAAAVQAAGAARDEQLAAGHTLSEEKEAAGEALAGARAAQRRAEAARAQGEGAYDDQKAAVQLLKRQVAECGATGAAEEAAGKAEEEEAEEEAAEEAEEEAAEEAAVAEAEAEASSTGPVPSIADISKGRLALQAEEKLFDASARALDVASLEASVIHGSSSARTPTASRALFSLTHVHGV
jgi:hypothetical protein